MPKPNVKEQIVAASLALFHSKGFNATSVQDITQAAGVPKGSFYNHFPSKEELGVEVVRRYHEAGVPYRALLDGQPEQDAQQRLRRHFGALVELGSAAQHRCGCLLGNFSTELSAQSPSIRAEVSGALQDWAGVLADTIAAGQQAGQIGGALPAPELANAVIDAWEGAVARSKVEASAAPLQRFLDLSLPALLR
ncbi:TetR/AcrR family transcriptional regulator [Oxalobacteraceae bacterium A2-2]